MTKNELLIEAAKILHGNHPRYAGLTDRFYNTKNYLQTYGREQAGAAEIAAEIRADIAAASEVTGLHPDRCGWIASLIEEGVAYGKRLEELRAPRAANACAICGSTNPSQHAAWCDQNNHRGYRRAV